MARTELTPIAAPGCYVTAPTQVTLTGADVPNKNSVMLTGRELLLIQNADTVAHNITITSVPDDKNRLGHITSFSVGAGLYYVFGPVQLAGWQQTDGRLYFEADNALIKFAVLRLP